MAGDDGLLPIGQAPYSNDVVVARYNTDGTLDTTFGGIGIVTTDVGERSSAYSALVQSDGKIVVAGDNGYVSFLVIRYEDDGTLWRRRHHADRMVLAGFALRASEVAGF